MSVQKVILYYAFAPLADPEAIKMWQRTLCESLGLKGRIIVSPHGINGTLGGDINLLKKYVKNTRGYEPFRKTEFKWSDGEAAPDGTSALFPRLSVKNRPELVAFGAPDDVKVTEEGIVDAGTHLTPQQVNELVEQREDVVFFDGRNTLESEIGRFKDAIRPEVETTHDFLAELDSGKYDHLKDKPIVTYCTGGIRCEILTPLMKQRGFKEVYQIKGGIVRYGETYGDEGLWEGSLYVFDKRMQMNFSDDPKIIGRCDRCDDFTPTPRDCTHMQCKAQYVRCDSCFEAQPFCVKHLTAEAVTA